MSAKRKRSGTDDSEDSDRSDNESQKRVAAPAATSSAAASSESYADTIHPLFEGGSVHVLVGGDVVNIVLSYCDAATVRFIAAHGTSLAPKSVFINQAVDDLRARLLPGKIGATWQHAASVATISRHITSLLDLTFSASGESGAADPRRREFAEDWIHEISKVVGRAEERIAMQQMQENMIDLLRVWLSYGHKSVTQHAGNAGDVMNRGIKLAQSLAPSAPRTGCESVFRSLCGLRIVETNFVGDDAVYDAETRNRHAQITIDVAMPEGSGINDVRIEFESNSDSNRMSDGGSGSDSGSGGGGGASGDESDGSGDIASDWTTPSRNVSNTMSVYIPRRAGPRFVSTSTPSGTLFSASVENAGPEPKPTLPTRWRQQLQAWLSGELMSIDQEKAAAATAATATAAARAITPLLSLRADQWACIWLLVAAASLLRGRHWKLIFKTLAKRVLEHAPREGTQSKPDTGGRGDSTKSKKKTKGSSTASVTATAAPAAKKKTRK